MAFDKPCLVKQQVVDKQAKPNGTKPLAVKLVLDIKHLTSFPSLGENAHECVHIWDGGGGEWGVRCGVQYPPKGGI